MNKKVVVISTSLRAKSNSDILAESFVKGEKAAGNDEVAMDGPISGMNGWVSCYGKARLAGTVFAGGVTEGGEINGHLALEKVFEMGKNI